MKNVFQRYRLVGTSAIFTGFGVLVGVVLFYGAAIAVVPQFITDDFYIFHLIQQNRYPIVVDNVQEKFYLFYRPVSYLYFRIIYALAGSDALIMKGMSVILVLASLSLSYAIIRRITMRYGKALSLPLTISFLIFFALHPDTIQSVLWISNANEILMVVFYLLSIWSTLSILDCDEKVIGFYSASAMAAFLFSIFTKQQSLHLPLLLLLFLIVDKGPFAPKRRRAVWIVSIVTCIAAAAVLIMNISLYISHDSSFSLLQSVWKKPFAAMGIILYSFFPLFGLNIYSFFLVHKELLLIPVLLFFPLAWIFIRLSQENRNIIIIGVILLSIVLFPRITLPVGDRINVLQVFSLTIGSAILISGRKMIAIVFTASIVLCTTIAGTISVHDLAAAVKYNESADRQLLELIKNNQSTNFIIAYYHPLFPTGHSFQYHRTREFGVDSKIRYTGLSVRHNMRWGIIPNTISTTLSGDTLSIRTTDENFNIVQDNSSQPYTIIDQQPNARGNSSMKALIPSVIGMKSPVFITYSDSGWVKLP